MSVYVYVCALCMYAYVCVKRRRMFSAVPRSLCELLCRLLRVCVCFMCIFVSNLGDRAAGLKFLCMYVFRMHQ